jgi:hypothetical protein
MQLYHSDTEITVSQSSSAVMFVGESDMLCEILSTLDRGYVNFIPNQCLSILTFCLLSI